MAYRFQDQRIGRCGLRPSDSASVPVLSELIGRRVVDDRNLRLGRLSDLVVSVMDPVPVVVGMVFGHGNGVAHAPREAVLDLEGRVIELGAANASPGAVPLRDHELLLRRDVLDAQVFDVSGRALSRVADVRLLRRLDRLYVTGVETGPSGVARRLGLRWLARHLPGDGVPWRDVHLVSGRGHGVMLRPGASGIGRLASSEVADLIGRLSVRKGAEVVRALPPDRAADVLRRTLPSLGGEIVAALEAPDAARILESMPSDDLTAALRHLDPTSRARILESVPSHRVEALRRLLSRPAQTAGGLMNPDVIVLSPSDRPESLISRIGRKPPQLDALLTVFVVDSKGRVVGAIQPRQLIAGNLTPTPMPTVSTDAPFSEVIDRFAVDDILALAVIDDDERLPGAQRRHTIRLGRRR